MFPWQHLCIMQHYNEVASEDDDDDAYEEKIGLMPDIKMFNKITKNTFHVYNFYSPGHAEKILCRSKI